MVNVPVAKIVDEIKKIIAIHNIDIVEFEYGYFWQLNYSELKINNVTFSRIDS